MSTLWSPQQREWLHAMGHQVWALGQAGDVSAEANAGEADATAADARREAAAMLRDEPVRRPPPARAPAAGDRLLAAVLRAANRGQGDRAVAALVPEPAALRGNAAAKRALWPSLRGLRRPGVGT